MAGLPLRILDELRGDAPSRWTLPLAPLGWLTELVIRVRNSRFDRGSGVHPVPIPVVSVGNLTVGGTTKTPTVSWLIRHLEDKQVVGVASRGYGGGGVELFRRGEADRSRVGDEPLLLSRRHPDVWVAVNPDRVAAVHALARKGVDCVVADDAFQHRRMSRAFDLVLVDVTSPWGNGRVIPAGSLREPWSGLSRANAVVLTRCDEVEPARLEEIRRRVLEVAGTKKAVEEVPVLTSRLRFAGWRSVQLNRGSELSRNLQVDTTSGKEPSGPVFVVTAVGRPTSVERTVRSLGLEIVGTDHYPDHHRWSVAEVEEFVRKASASGAAAIVCTEKDLYNLPDGVQSRLTFWVPIVDVEIESGSRLQSAIQSRLCVDR